MLDKAISYASNYTTVSLEDIRIIKHSRKSLLFQLASLEEKRKQ